MRDIGEVLAKAEAAERENDLFRKMLAGANKKASVGIIDSLVMLLRAGYRHDRREWYLSQERMEFLSLEIPGLHDALRFVDKP